jgi:acetoin utilization deacetylase AcuC-like enzyme
MRVWRPRPATNAQMQRFHTSDYIDFLSSITPENMDEYMTQVCLSA